ncbi:MAG: hypothetical protein JO011_04765 [Ktedonobacteraceae bacterium]|nr:hypothetical protein [Ktedonobacteraceae bacterium]
MHLAPAALVALDSLFSPASAFADQAVALAFSYQVSAYFYHFFDRPQTHTWLF